MPMLKSLSFDSQLSKLSNKFKRRTPSVPVKSDETLFEEHPPAYSVIEEEPSTQLISNDDLYYGKKERVLSEKQQWMQSLNNPEERFGPKVDRFRQNPFMETASDSDSDYDERECLLRERRAPKVPLRHAKPPQLPPRNPPTASQHPIPTHHTKQEFKASPRLSRIHKKDARMVALERVIQETSDDAHQVIVKIVAREGQLSELQHRAGRSLSELL